MAEEPKQEADATPEAVSAASAPQAASTAGPSLTPSLVAEEAASPAAGQRDGNAGAAQAGAAALVLPFSALRREDIAFAGGKGANLGELTAAGLPVPDGFVVGAPAYAAFCDHSRLRQRIEQTLGEVDFEDTAALQAASAAARGLIGEAEMPAQIQRAVAAAYEGLVGGGPASARVAVRSSATAEDTAEASFAGMNETFLNVTGADAVIDALRRCWASLFGARTVYYRAVNRLPQAAMDIAVAIQRQVASTRAGVMFTVNPATGDRDELVIEGSFGLGEAVVSGSVSPDRWVVDKRTLAIKRREVRRKELIVEMGPDGGTTSRQLSEREGLRPALSDEEAVAVAQLGQRIEQHYGAPQDTEWAFDEVGALWMLQSRPITTLQKHPPSALAPAEAQPSAAAPQPSPAEAPSKVLLRGLGGAPGSASGAARILSSLQEASALGDGDVLVTHMTAPDWLPLMRRASAIVTDSGGMTCHAAIVSRELGIPCVVGTGEATKRLRDGEIVTVDATRGVVLEGGAPPGTGGGSALPGAGAAAPSPGGAAQEAGAAPTVLRAPRGGLVTATKILVNLSEPSQVERVRGMDVDGVGLLRAEMMILEALGGEHPRQLVEEGRSEELVSRMAENLDAFASGFQPRPVTYRTIDFRTNEFSGLRGGDRFEPSESNPMIGYRGALRYTREPDVFGLELEAVARVWDSGRRNLHVMLPFVRTAGELRRCSELIARSGLLDRDGFELWVMAEVPSVLFNLERYAALGVRGISIGSNDLTQLLLGADRDNPELAEIFDERDPAVTAYLRELIPKARDLGLSTSICGQAPSVHPEYAELLVRAGIDAISVNIDVIDRTRALVAAAERRVILEAARLEAARR